MTVGVGLDGLPELVARLDRAHDGLLDLSGINRDMAQLVARKATPDTPRATGRLAGSATISATGTGWGITYGAPYSALVHWGTRYMRPRPWLIEAARDTEDSWMDALTEHVQQLLE